MRLTMISDIGACRNIPYESGFQATADKRSREGPQDRRAARHTTATNQPLRAVGFCCTTAPAGTEAAPGAWSHVRTAAGSRTEGMSSGNSPGHVSLPTALQERTPGVSKPCSSSTATPSVPPRQIFSPVDIPVGDPTSPVRLQGYMCGVGAQVQPYTLQPQPLLPHCLCSATELSLCLLSLKLTLVSPLLCGKQGRHANSDLI